MCSLKWYKLKVYSFSLWSVARAFSAMSSLAKLLIGIVCSSLLDRPPEKYESTITFYNFRIVSFQFFFSPGVWNKALRLELFIRAIYNRSNWLKWLYYGCDLKGTWFEYIQFYVILITFKNSSYSIFVFKWS